MMRLRAAALLSAALLCWSTPAHAWDEVGHKVVARIAWNHMTPAARQHAIRLLQAAPPNSGIAELLPRDGRPLEERQRDWFVNASYWPDQIRSREHPGFRYAHSDWHYVNFFWEQRPDGTRRDRPDIPRAGFLIDQEMRIAAALGSPSVPDSAKATDLPWLLHLVGDAHQPMHNSARITARDTAGDRGANEFRLAGLYPFNNLHAYWDALIGFSVPWTSASRTEHDHVGSVARQIAARYPLTAMRGRVLPGQFETWSREGMRVAQAVGYPSWLIRDQRAPARYRPHAWAAAQPRVALAGYRLADVLNRALGS
ncbi:MAG TPA: S1/P1 nuclease [Longimicrobium sp.]|nr:S1/P1 nuclease [Longimicrobium sp.]